MMKGACIRNKSQQYSHSKRFKRRWRKVIEPEERPACYICIACMKKRFETSLCISTYNHPHALELCLKSVLAQTFFPDEIIIGDDGSAEETKVLIDSLKQHFSIPLIHVWHPDEGFRLAAIRNKSFAAASGDYIIQFDGDVVLHKRFVEDHVKFAKPNAFVAGTRSLLVEAATQQLLQHKDLNELPNLSLEKRYNAIRSLPLARAIYHLQQGLKQTRYVLGANMAFWKIDLQKVNGYNEDYKGWGKEDNDLSIRLCNAGVRLHFLRFAAIIYHLHHKEAPRDAITANELLLMQVVKEHQTFVENGMSKYL